MYTISQREGSVGRTCYWI